MKAIQITSEQAENLYNAVKQMRWHQTFYFKYRDFKALNNSKKWEAKTDGIISQIDFCNDENKESLLFSAKDFVYSNND